MQQRRGRQDEDVAAAADDMNAVDAEYDDAEGSGGEELYNGCDWKTNIGGFLNFCKWRKWCADNQGITDFGPYGGVPTACPPEEEGAEAADEPVAAADEAAEVEAEAPAEEARRRARARKSRARRGRKSGAAKKKSGRRGGRRAGKKNRKNRSG